MTRRPLLMAAALGVAAIPIVLLTLPDRPRPQAERQGLRTFDAQAEPPPAMAAPVSLPAMPAPPPPPAAPSSSAQGTPQQLSPTADPLLPEVAPRVAYSYGFRFRVPAAALASVQERHLQLCLAMGQARCRIVSMRRSETQPAPPARDHGYGGGRAEPAAPAASLEVQVAAPLADEFGRRLTASAGEAGGETVDRQIGADDVSREMVDSEARIRTRETLIRRLSTLLETRSGNIEQAVQAERAINAAQEELDAARTWLAETRGRVAMSKIAIFYESSGAAAVAAERDPIGKALGQAGSIATQSIAIILLIVALTLPWAAIALLLWQLARWYRRRKGLAPSLSRE